jgi:hypothetical protein
MKAIFLKESTYKGKKYNKYDIVDMSLKDFNAYKKLYIVDYAIRYNINRKEDYNNMSYRDLQKICKNKNLYAVGTKEDLIKTLESQEGA